MIREIAKKKFIRSKINILEEISSEKNYSAQFFFKRGYLDL